MRSGVAQELGRHVRRQHMLLYISVLAHHPQDCPQSQRKLHSGTLYGLFTSLLNQVQLLGETSLPCILLLEFCITQPLVQLLVPVRLFEHCPAPLFESAQS